MLVLRLRPLAFATFLVWRLRIGACGFGAYDSYPSLPTLRIKSLAFFLHLSSFCDYFKLIFLL